MPRPFATPQPAAPPLRLAQPDAAAEAPVFHPPLPPIADPDAFDCRILTDYMAPDFLVGDVVTFSPRSSVPAGHPCCVTFTNGKETVARVVFGHDDTGRAILTLTPANPADRPRIVPRESVAAIAPAVRLTRPLLP